MWYCFNILVQDFCPLKIKITQFPDGFRLNRCAVQTHYSVLQYSNRYEEEIRQNQFHQGALTSIIINFLQIGDFHMHNIKNWKGLAQLFQDWIHTNHWHPCSTETGNSSNGWIKAYKQKQTIIFGIQLTHRSPHFLFFDYYYFYWDSLREPLWRREVLTLPL